MWTGKHQKSDLDLGPLEEVSAYWEALRDDGQVPTRAMVDPRGIEKALRNAFVLERVAPRVARIRIAGSHMESLLGMDPRGLPISLLFSSSSRLQAAELLEGVFAGPSRLRLQLAAESSLGKPFLQGELLLLPLRGEGGQVNRAIGALVTSQSVGAAPRSLEIKSSFQRALATSNRHADLQSVSPLPYENPPQRTAGAAHLRLVVDN